MITMVYIGFIIMMVAAVIMTNTIASKADNAKKKCEELYDDVSDLKDEIFYLKMEIDKLKAGTPN